MIKKILNYAKNYKKHFYISIILMLSSLASWVIGFVVVYFLIQAFLINTINTYLLIKYSTIIFLAFAFKALLMNIALRHSHIFAYNSLSEIRKEFVTKMINNPLGTTLTQSAGSYRQKLVDGIEQIELLLAHAFPEGLPYLMTIFIVIIMIFIIDLRLGLLSLVPIAIGLLIMAINLKKGMPKMTEYYKSSKDMSSNIVEYIRGIEVIKIFNHNKQSYKKLTNSVYNYRDYTLSWFRETWTAMAISNTLTTTVSLLIIPIGLLFLINGSLSLSKFIFSCLLSFSLTWPMTKVPYFMSTFAQINKKLKDLENDFKAVELKTGRKTIESKNINIFYKNVQFSYDKELVISDATFEIKSGEKVVFVGESGSGKSTLVKLLMHYYDTSNGDIYLEEKSIKDISLESLMDKISYVSQDNFLFNISIIDNILIGNPKASFNDVQIACKAANIHEFILTLENGYDTKVGDSGDKLSGGQKQRLCIARAIIKNSPIIILDEATSFTDPENEYYINKAIDELLKDKTVLIIAHKLSRAVDADKIILIDQGKIKQIGKHEELLKNSIYKKLWNRYVSSSDFEFTTKDNK
ncbi:MAG: ABC transporter ATP-binding protein [Sphaerochaetaceae bacterium]|nr:ABC transporter ATP-binding protein [Sphaerochaetaceae bacterium]MDC7238169.1 ABC transporter ATP-binding protein [Sphaerochaetaceae bacterium]